MLRPADRQDTRFLRDMLRHAYHWRIDRGCRAARLPVRPNWGRPGDAGVIAFEGPNAYGAAWYRVFTADEPGFGFVDEKTPELTIARRPEPPRQRRGQGAARGATRAGAQRRLSRAISLSAEPRADRWYEKFGFETVRESPHAVTMVEDALSTLGQHGRRRRSSREAGPAGTPPRSAPRSSARRSPASRRSPSSAARASASAASRRRPGCRPRSR